MKKLLFLVVFVVLTTALGSVVYETASFKDFIFGSTEDTAYDNWLSRVVEGLAREDYNVYAPWDRQTNGFGNFLTPTSEDLDQWQEIVDFFLNEDFVEAESAIEEYGYPYEIVEFTDTDTDRIYYMLRELVNYDYFDDNGYPYNSSLHQTGSFDYGWGLYVINPSSENLVIVNVVHPKDDFISVPIAVEAFQMWDAQVFMVAGAGREAGWEAGSFENNSSISDPSRVLEHPFNVFYQSVCDKIREEFSRRELSIQIHSFDYTHPSGLGTPSIQIASMNRLSNDRYQALPAMDTSGNFNDLVNATPYQVFPANTIGVHQEVSVTNYYSVLWSIHPLHYDNEGTLIEIDNNVFLSPLSWNRQREYSNGGWNRFDVFHPFFHIELRELPNIYPQTASMFRWFYGYNSESNSWDSNNFYTKALQFYRPWLEATAQVLPDVIELDDGMPPTQPTNLRIASQTSTSVELNWNRSSAYDFESYEIFYSREAIDPETTPFICRDDHLSLAGQLFTKLTIEDLSQENQYYFMIRARDYNGRYSEPSDIITRYPVVEISESKIYGLDEVIELTWTAATQNNNRGFRVWRSVGDDNYFEVISCWQTNSDLEGSDEPNVHYSYVDTNAINGETHRYRIAAVDDAYVELFYPTFLEAKPERVFSLSVQKESSVASDTMEFGKNEFATDGIDYGYDLPKTTWPNNGYLVIYSVETVENDSFFLQRNIYEGYDTGREFKVWDIVVSSDFIDRRFILSLSENYTEETDLMYLYDTVEETFTDILRTDYEYVHSSNERLFKLYWGRTIPDVVISEQQSIILQSTDIFHADWSIDGNPEMIDDFKLLLISESDTLLIAENHNPQGNGIFYQIPEDMSIERARFVIEVNDLIGYSEHFSSDYLVTIVPKALTFQNSAGWQLKTNPHRYNFLPGELYFGDNSQLYRLYEDNHYYETALFLPEVPVWVFLPYDQEISLEGTIGKWEYREYALDEGWNFVPNPYGVSFPVKDLNFWTADNGELFTFQQGVESNLLNKGLFGLRDNRYRLIERVEISDAFWLYAHQENIIIRFDPFAVNDVFQPQEKIWEVAVAVSSDNHLVDEVIIGSAETAEMSYNPMLDLPKPYIRPVYTFELYLEAEEEGYPFAKFHQLIKRDTLEEENEDIYWDFRFETDLENYPVFFSLKSVNLPDGYNVVLMTDELFVNLSEEEFVYHGSEEVITGRIMITSDEVTSATMDLPYVTELLKNYPNPFSVGKHTRSGGTVIPFTLSEKSFVSLAVYNVKGQRVANIAAQELEPGKHTMTWEGRNDFGQPVSAGIYFYRMQTNKGVTKIQKMLLLK